MGKKDASLAVQKELEQTRELVVRYAKEIEAAQVENASNLLMNVGLGNDEITPKCRLN